MDKSYKIKNRIWICTDEGTFLGEGRINLLREIEKTGSISEAAKKMNMSYKKAWNLVQSINKQSETPIVNRKIGGVDGGGSAISPKGLEWITIYNEINENCNRFLEEEIAKHIKIIR